MVLIVKMATT